MTDRRRWYALGLICTAFFMVVLDSTIVYTALPSIANDLGFSPADVQWVISAYALTFGGLLLLGGRAADLLGRRCMFMASIAVFAVSSLVCGLAWSGTALIAARAVQGLAGAVLTPAGLSILMTVFTDGPQRNKALGVWGGLGGIGATAGLLIGGPVTDALGWEWIFFMNVPIGMVVLAVCPVLLREGRDRERRRSFDLAGALSITAALTLLVYAIVESPQAGWASAQTIGPLAGSAALVALFVVIESRSAAPLVPLRIFRSRTLVGGNLVVLAAGMAVDAMLLIVTLYAQQVLGYSALQFGLTMAVMTVMSIVGVVAGQHFVTRLGFGPVAASGMVLIGVGCLLLTRISVNGTLAGDLLLPLLIFGPGMGAAFVASQIAALAGVAEHESGLASGIEETSFSMGAPLGIAIVTAIAVSRTDHLVAGGAEPQLAQTQGYQLASGAAVGFAILGLLAALTLLWRRPARVESAPDLPPPARSGVS